MAKKNAQEILVLGIESSCDDTAAAIVRRTPKGQAEILSNILHHQIEDHAPYGGVVPEIAARAHLAHLDAVIARAMKDAGCRFSDLDGIAATAGPGLIGGVIVGLVSAKTLALAHGLPLLAINHLEGHALSVGLGERSRFPYLAILLSGGHSAFVSVLQGGRYRRLGGTLDDASGEAFDKTARLLGLPYPGGALLEELAKEGDPTRFKLPRPLEGEPHCDMSFSGLKSAVRRLIEKTPPSHQDKRDLAASFQETIAQILAERTERALIAHEAWLAHLNAPAIIETAPARKRFLFKRSVFKRNRRVGRGEKEPTRRMIAAGGVAANSTIRTRLRMVAKGRGYLFSVPAPDLCTDNGAMIAWAGAEQLARGESDTLRFSPRAQWPL